MPLITITFELPCNEDHFENKFQYNIYPSDTSFEKQEQQLIEFKEKQQIEPCILSSEHIENKVITLTSGASYSKDIFDSKLQAKFEKSDQSSEQQQ